MWKASPSLQTDADSDPITYGTNASHGVLNKTTGEYSWTTNSSDVGTYTWYFNSSDNYGGIDTETITVTVIPSSQSRIYPSSSSKSCNHPG